MRGRRPTGHWRGNIVRFLDCFPFKGVCLYVRARSVARYRGGHAGEVYFGSVSSWPGSKFFSEDAGIFSILDLARDRLGARALACHVSRLHERLSLPTPHQSHRPLPYGDCPRRADGLHSGGFAPLDPRQRPKRGGAPAALPESGPYLSRNSVKLRLTLFNRDALIFARCRGVQRRQPALRSIGRGGRIGRRNPRSGPRFRRLWRAGPSRRAAAYSSSRCYPGRAPILRP